MTFSDDAMMSDSTPWYAEEGLHFKCTECGQCCTGSPGYVWVNEQEMEAMAEELNLSILAFKNRYTRQIGDRYSLLESRKTYDCIFLKENKCQLYHSRPTQCRTFPYWPQNLASKKAWEQTARQCEGINNQAPRISFETIETEREKQVLRNETAC